MSLIRAAAVLGVVCASAAAQLGPIEPPVGPVGDTGPDLGEVEPRTPIGDDTTPGGGNFLFIIDEPGSYYLTANVTTATNGVSGIQILADNVTIDLMGFTLRSTAASPGPGITYSFERLACTVRNGTIEGWFDGIRGAGANQCRFERLILRQNLQDGMTVGDDCFVVDCLAYENGAFGFDLDSNGVIRGCTSADNGSAGYFLAANGGVTDCAANQNVGDGFDLSTGGMVSNCRSSVNGGDGIDVGSDSLVTGCLSEDNTGAGVRALSDGLIERCMVTSNDGGGIIGGTDATVDMNTVTDNSVIGFRCPGGLIIRNRLSGNTSPIDTTDTVFGSIIVSGGLVDTQSTYANILY